MIGAMTVLQLVVSEHDGGERTLDAVPNEAQNPPYTFDTPRTAALPIGSQGLVELAHSLRSDNYMVHDLTLVDRTFTRLTDDTANTLHDALIAEIRTGNSESLNQFTRTVLRGYYVLDIQFRDVQDGGRVTLVQDGIVQTSSQKQVGKFASVVRRALKFGSTE